MGAADSHDGAHSSQGCMLFGTRRLANAWRHEARRVLMKNLVASLASADGGPKPARHPRDDGDDVQRLEPIGKPSGALRPHRFASAALIGTRPVPRNDRAAFDITGNIRLRLLVTSWIL
jgi:hypothetical protein